MTREEAKAILLQSKMQCEYPHGAYGVAVDIAIKAIEQEPKEIYAKGYIDGQRVFAEHIELCKEEQEPKTGRWITGKWSDDAIRYNDTEYKCSLCHHRSDFTSHFCPNCGCRMESEGMI